MTLVTADGASVYVQEVRATRGPPNWDGTTYNLTVADWHTYFVGGAITDGASVCLLRVSRFANDPPPEIDQISLSIRKHDDIHANGTPIESATTTQAGGTLTPAQLIEPGRFLPTEMTLPTPWPPTGSTECVAHEGLAYYVPPESYIDPTYSAGSSGQTLNDKETCMMSFVGSVGGKRIPGGRSFVLRRPPIILVHGLNSSGQTWSAAVWRSDNDLGDMNQPYGQQRSPGMATTVFTLDYGSSNSSGYDKNWTKVARGINEALWMYRQGSVDSDSTIRWAATRLDIVGHSMGGLITRLYVSELHVPQLTSRGPQLDKFSIPRTYNVNDGTGAWFYLRPDNFGAGSIRRFISVGSPFDGSDFANAVVATLRETTHVRGAWEVWKRAPGLIRRGGSPFPGEIQPGVGAILEGAAPPAPAAYIDLMPGSVLQTMIDNAPFPQTQKRPRWHPIVGFANANIPARQWIESIWNGTIRRLSGATGFAKIDPFGGDLVVEGDSQANGQLNVATIVNNTVHAPFAGMATLHLYSETASPTVAQRVRELLSTDPQVNWEGDLK